MIAKVVLSVLVCSIAAVSAKYPNVIMMVGDDLAINDLGYVNDEVQTENIDKFAKEGVILKNNYVVNVCTPTRHALMTGRYPFKTQMAHIVLFVNQAHCSPTDIKFMPQYFKDAGYNTYMAGKWHLGFCQEECVPTSRGFDHLYGFYQGKQDYITHTDGRPGNLGYDWRKDKDIDYSAKGIHSTYLLTDYVVDMIDNYDSTDPFFLYLAYPNPHGPLKVPDVYYDKYPDVEGERCLYLALITMMDESLGNITTALRNKGMFDDTLLIYTSDNGGEGFGNHGDYRGSKGSMFEAGVRALSFVYGSMLNKKGYVHEGLFHVTDWLPTIMGIIGNDAFFDDKNSSYVDGIDQSDMILNGGPSLRDEIIFNIDMMPMPVMGQSAVRRGKLKFIWGSYGTTDGYGKDGTILEFYKNQTLRQAAGLSDSYVGSSSKARRGIDFSATNQKAMLAITNRLGWTEEDTDNPNTRMYLFDLEDDPFEENNLAYDAEYADEVSDMKKFILNEVKNNYREVSDLGKVNRASGNPDQNGGLWVVGWCDDLDILQNDA